MDPLSAGEFGQRSTKVYSIDKTIGALPPNDTSAPFFWTDCTRQIKTLVIFSYHYRFDRICDC